VNFVSGRDEAELAGLLRAAIAGDEKAYAVFLARAAALVRGFVRRRMTPGGIDPEDVVQETLLAIHLKRHTWRDDAPVLPWVYAIARYKLIDAFRRRGRRIEVDVDDFADTIAQPEAGPSASATSPGRWTVFHRASARWCRRSPSTAARSARRRDNWV
jgi:RNA polymerase sigma-70 factor (ECF subfamily)